MDVWGVLPMGAGEEQAENISREHLWALEHSAFARIERRAHRYSLQSTPEEVVGFLLSTSILSVARLGGQERHEAFIAALIDRLRALAPVNQRLVREIEVRAALARRPY